MAARYIFIYGLISVEEEPALGVGQQAWLCLGARSVRCPHRRGPVSVRLVIRPQSRVWDVRVSRGGVDVTAVTGR